MEAGKRKFFRKSKEEKASFPFPRKGKDLKSFVSFIVYK
jgi:hypothetical protein